MRDIDVGRSLRIGQVAARAGVSTKTVRYYESIGLLRHPPRSLKGYRQYVREDISRIAFIRRAQALGLSLASIRDILALQDSGGSPCSEVRMAATRRVDELNSQLADLERLRDELSALASRAELTRMDEQSGCEYCPAILQAPGLNLQA